MRVEHPLDGIGRAELAVEIRGSGRMGDEQLLLLIGYVLHRQADGRNRHVHNQVDLFGVVPAARDGGADVRLDLMIAVALADGLAQLLAAEIVHRHLGRGDRALASGGGSRPVHVCEDADLDDIVRDLRHGRRGIRRGGEDYREHGYSGG